MDGHPVENFTEQRLYQAFVNYCGIRLEAFNRGEGEPLDGKTLEVIGKMLEKADISKPKPTGFDPNMDADADKASAVLLKKYGYATSD